MQGEFRNISVPSEFETEVSILVEKLQEAAGDKSGFEKGDVELLQPDAKHLGPGDVITPVLSMTGVVATWITKAWFEKYVLPTIMQRLKRPSERFERWFRQALGVKR